MSRSLTPSRVIATFALALGLVAGASGCGRVEQAAKDMQPGKAFLDSQIPPGLSPQYFPPQGFVWGAYRASGLPEARYGVASPPVNPRAQVLILADADYPAESYFELANQLLADGYGVWLFEGPGQGGAGHYLLQSQSVFTRSYHDGQLSALSFVHDIVHPTQDKPLFIVGTGFSALNALSLSTTSRDKSLAGFIAYQPYLGGDIARGTEWHRDAAIPTYWGTIAQAWQMSNPDLRLRIKSDTWQQQTRKAFADLNSLHLPVVSLTAQAAPVLIIEPRDAPAADDTGASALCARLSHCRTLVTSGPETLGDEVSGFIHAQMPAAG